MKTHHWYEAMFGEFSGLADMEFEQAMFFGKYHHEVGLMIVKVFPDAFFHLMGTNKMDIRIKLPEMLLPDI